LRHEAYIARRVNLPQVGGLAENQNHGHIPRHPASIRGTLRDRHERGKRDAMDAERRETNVATRTAKSCGPGAPGLASSVRVTNLQATVTNKVMDTGESTKQPLTPLRRECRCFGFICGDYTCVLSTIAHKAAGAAKHPAFPAPSDFFGRSMQQLGRNSRRECEVASTAVMSRQRVARMRAR
jgi:hypothetical protein